jgi:putative two-component system response regulator
MGSAYCGTEAPRDSEVDGQQQMRRSYGDPSLRVLLIEDSSDDAELIVAALRKAGFEVTDQCVMTEAAMQVALQEQSWDLVVCDYTLPRFTPYRALELLRASDQDIPLIVFSGAVQEDVAVELLKAGASDFITKDRMPRLILAVRRELREKEQRAQHRLELEIAYEQTIMAWGKALELRDTYTQGHTLRVTDLVLRLARIFDISGPQFKNIYRGGLLHDIGKMAIPDAILMKRDVLTSDEKKIMEMHPVLAYELLSPIAFLRASLDIPYCHHEKWNGSGYPRGLMGNEIPFAARLFSVADVYDALSNDRPYRLSWAKPKVIEYLQEERRRSFDPEVVDRFIGMVGRA